MQKKNESSLVLVDPGVVGAAPVDDAIREPECNLLLGALNGVAAVDDVPADLNAVVAADGARVRGGRVSGADDLAAGSDDALALPHHGDDGAGDDVLDEGAEEGLGREVGVVLLREGALHLHQLQGFEEETLLLEAADDVADETALHAVRLDHDEGDLGVGHGEGCGEARRGERAAAERWAAAMAKSVRRWKLYRVSYLWNTLRDGRHQCWPGISQICLSRT